MATSRSRPFGSLADGTEVQEVTIEGGGLSVDVLTLGAVIRHIRVDTPDGPRPVVLGFDRLDHYLDHSPYFGAVAGRCANRTRGGDLPIDGRHFQLDRNEAGRTHLHGGRGGFGARVWSIVDRADDAVTLELVSADGDQGYPGTVIARCRYAATGEGRLTIDLTAVTDAPTAVNLATHSYFDLDRGETILDHVLTIAADAVTPVDEALVPTGAVTPVAGTALDFRTSQPVGVAGGSLDLNYVLADAPRPEPRFAARLEGAVSGLSLEVWTTEPGLQVYDGNMMAVPVPGADGREVRRNGGICLEPQRWPDAVHHPDFPNVILRPGETYRQRTEYRFQHRVADA
jgi:aldose 1-epimerase